MIERASLRDRGVYTLRSRNLTIGVWSEPRGGFVGIRQKFDARYLFTEFFNDGISPVGTATPLEDLGITVPADIVLIESLRDEAGKFKLNVKGYVLGNPPLLEMLEHIEIERV